MARVGQFVRGRTERVGERKWGGQQPVLEDSGGHCFADAAVDIINGRFPRRVLYTHVAALLRRVSHFFPRASLPGFFVLLFTVPHRLVTADFDARSRRIADEAALRGRCSVMVASRVIFLRLMESFAVE